VTLRHIAGTPYAAASYDADIIILALDRVEETIAAINSARSQTGVDAAVWILDQGSKPENRSRIQEAVAGRCCLYSADRNLGVAEGRNVASGLGHGRIVVALDNDAIFAMPETVARMVAAIDAEPTLAAIGCRIITDSTGCDDLSSWGYPHDWTPPKTS